MSPPDVLLSVRRDTDVFVFVTNINIFDIYKSIKYVTLTSNFVNIKVFAAYLYLNYVIIYIINALKQKCEFVF